MGFKDEGLNLTSMSPSCNSMDACNGSTSVKRVHHCALEHKYQSWNQVKLYGANGDVASPCPLVDFVSGRNTSLYADEDVELVDDSNHHGCGISCYWSKASIMRESNPTWDFKVPQTRLWILKTSHYCLDACNGSSLVKRVHHCALEHKYQYWNQVKLYGANGDVASPCPLVDVVSGSNTSLYSDEDVELADDSNHHGYGISCYWSKTPILRESNLTLDFKVPQSRLWILKTSHYCLGILLRHLVRINEARLINQNMPRGD
ncbi:hypothetical protein F3Y22_tig00110429pilonHSYRG00148 [Hibiscus syriacus]|uniref:Uncharacterized protein n=1 Tax=Hibiscus syriacus TaxID=106335 RepID=A0A6A3AKR2_HIBSY|nr:hypothetical protein F3Y22_tig00110429pilonHSYRG00148 [Hibiscus syriacus]